MVNKTFVTAACAAICAKILMGFMSGQDLMGGMGLAHCE
ncbi:hypothetical protein CCP3SC1_730011 [Gammaproteobacteria bacterium]